MLGVLGLVGSLFGGLGLVGLVGRVGGPLRLSWVSDWSDESDYSEVLLRNFLINN